MKKPKKLTKAYIERVKKRQNKRTFKDNLLIFKKTVAERDNYMCQKCGKLLPETRRQNIHHILPKCKKYEHLITNPINGILLCAYCHKWAYYSPHHNSLHFGLWLQLNKPEQYSYLSKIVFNDLGLLDNIINK